MGTRRVFRAFRLGIVTACALGLMLSSGTARGQDPNDPNAPAGPLSKDEQKCVVEASRNLAKVAKAQGKDIVNCIKNGGKGKSDKLGGPPSTIQSCTTADAKGKVAKAEGKLGTKVADKCAGRSPAFGTNVPGSAPDADALNALATAREFVLFHRIFGSSLDEAIVRLDKDSDRNSGTNTKAEGKCQVEIAKNAQKCLDTKWKSYNRCKKNALKGKTGPPATSGADLEACLASVQSDAKVTKTCLTKFSEKMAKKCGSVDLANVLPDSGVAAATGIQPYADARVECEFCLMVNGADGLSVDCDAFDDGDPDNGSCAFMNALCALDPNSSGATLNTTVLSLPLPTKLNGVVGIRCGPPDADGVAVCECKLVSPRLTIPLPAPLPTACLTAVEGCALGRIDCSGGEPLDAELILQHDAGAALKAIVDPNGQPNDPNTVGNIPFCGLGLAGQDPNNGPAECSAICDLYCPTLGVDFTTVRARCEGYCLDGAFADRPCSETLADCVPGGIGGDEDNGGECIGTGGTATVAGPDGVGGKHPHTCQCICGRIDGGPSSPGGLACEIGLRTILINDPNCVGEAGDIVGDQCLSFSTEGATATVESANLDPNSTIEVLGSGNRVSCEDLQNGRLTGLSLRGSQVSPDGALGDLVILIDQTCQ